MRTKSPDGAQAFDWRKHLKVHPTCAALPELSPAERVALGRNIEQNGMRVPILIHVEGDTDPEFQLLDGRSRLDAMVAVGVEFKFERGHCKEHGAWLHLNITSDIPIALPDGNTQTARGFSEEEINSLVASLNVHRRHLTAEQKRDAIDALLKLDPGKSDRQIAEQTRSSPTTVGKRRKKAETAGDVSTLDTRTDKRGRAQPATKQTRAAKPAETKAEPKAATSAADAFDLYGALLSMTRTGKLDHTAIHTVVEEVRFNPGQVDFIRTAAAFYTAVVAEIDKVRP
jgi:hypothetical protein